MPWALTTTASIEAAARAALAAAYPLAKDASRDPRAKPAGRVPFFAVAVLRGASAAAGMREPADIVEGELRVAVTVECPADRRPELADLADHVRATIFGDAVLGDLLGSLDVASDSTETEAQAEAFARVDVVFSVSWLEVAAAASGATPARFGLA